MIEKIEMRDVSGNQLIEMNAGARTTLITGDDELHQKLLLDAVWRCMTTEGTPQAGTERRPTNRATVTIRAPDGTVTTLPSTTEEPAGNRRHRQPSVIYTDRNARVHAHVAHPRDRRKTTTRIDIEDLGGHESLERVVEALRHDSPADGEGLEELLRILEVLIPDEDRTNELSLNDASEPAYRPTRSGTAKRAAIALASEWVLNGGDRRSRAEGIVLLMDEPGLDLHPNEQRTVLPKLLEMDEKRTLEGPVQLVAATRAPMVLASMEPLFDEVRDRFWTIDVDPETWVTTAVQQPFVKHGSGGR